MQSISSIKKLLPGLAISILIAIFSKYLGHYYGMPSMLLALLLGLSMNSLFEGTGIEKGIMFAAQPLLRFSVGLLGIRVSYEMLAEIGLPFLILVAFSILATIAFGILISKLCGEKAEIGILTGGSVAICGASAAVALSSVLPNDQESEKRLTATVFGVTVLSTFAMILYPGLTAVFEYSDSVAGVFLGATIHDVAQVVGAGLAISDEAGSTAILIKLYRVSMLAPVVLILSIVVRFYCTRNHSEVVSTKNPQLLPSFVILFLVLAIGNSFEVIPAAIRDVAGAASSWGLLAAISAVGVKTSFRGFWKYGSFIFYCIAAETIFLALLIFFGISLFM